MTEDLNERIVSLTTALLERDQRILDLEAELRAKEGYIPPPPSGLPTVVIEGINDMADNIRGKIERTKVLEEENEGYKSKEAYVEPSDDEYDDIPSDDTTTIPAAELSMVNNALMNAQDEIERLEGIVAQREEEIMALEEENEELISTGPYERAERLNVLAKAALEINIEPTIDLLNDHTCLICLDNTTGPFIRTDKCNPDHGVCFKCFVHLMNGPGRAQCPICMTKWEEGNLLIE